MVGVDVAEGGVELGVELKGITVVRLVGYSFYKGGGIFGWFGGVGSGGRSST